MNSGASRVVLFRETKTFFSLDVMVLGVAPKPGTGDGVTVWALLMSLEMYLYTGHASISNESDSEVQVVVEEGPSLGLQQFIITAEASASGP